LEQRHTATAQHPAAVSAPTPPPLLFATTDSLIVT
jgi:hypothetical protein